eukprot:GHVU01085455.1.p2 GENE.GHVU01085455.1~~GHVU01085455.1.p2  ORF type:complete len:148 (+),score=11.68 GHVU01085455.1:344-787(+)
MSDPPSFDDMPSGAACQICFEDFSEANYAKYTTANNDKTWHGSLFCSDCIKRLIETQFGVYCKEIQQTDCMKTLRSLLERGPPINVRDKYGFPEAGDEEVGLLCFSSDKAVWSQSGCGISLHVSLASHFPASNSGAPSQAKGFGDRP